jgi:hypothetical protein
MRELLLTHVSIWDADITMSELRSDEFGYDRVHINHLYALIKGGGSRALSMVCQNADDLEITLSLNACCLTSALYPTQWQPEKLVAWYAKHGFAKAESRDSSFLFMGRLMVRTPDSTCGSVSRASGDKLCI